MGCIPIFNLQKERVDTSRMNSNTMGQFQNEKKKKCEDLGSFLYYRKNNKKILPVFGKNILFINQNPHHTNEMETKGPGHSLAFQLTKYGLVRHEGSHSSVSSFTTELMITKQRLKYMQLVFQYFCFQTKIDVRL